jgi:hypothetical protein
MSRKLRKRSAGAHVLLHRTKVSISIFPCPQLNTIWAVSYPYRLSTLLCSAKYYCFIFQRHSFNLRDAGKHWLRVSRDDRTDFILETRVTFQERGRKGTMLRNRHIPYIAREVLTFSPLYVKDCALSHLCFVAGDVTPKVRMKLKLSQYIIKRQAIKTHSGIQIQL